MAFERNDIVNKTRLMGELGEELMGFEHNDIVTVDVMNEAIAEGGGGGDTEYVEVTFQLGEDISETTYIYGFFVSDYGQEGEYIEPYFGIESGTTTVHVPLYKGNGSVYARTYGGSNCWFEGDNITELGVLTGGGTVTIHESTD